MKVVSKQDYLRKIPSVDEVLKKPEVHKLYEKYPRSAVVRAVQMILAETRKELLAGAEEPHGTGELSVEVTSEHLEAKLAEILRPSLKRVINATGIVIHTNLGRAPLAEEAVRCAADIALHYSNLEFDLDRGERGSRYTHVTGLLQELTGAESAFVVNNNAAAVLLCLSAFATGRDVLISRGELIEIGGSFRIPDVMAQSGAHLREVGTTNRTHLRDYQQAINENTALILKVHTSNYKIVGFTSEVSLAELKQLGMEFHLPVMFDLGSGNIANAAPLGLSDEPTVQDAVKQGADLITFSGDKLVGGPQAGMILGGKQYIEAITKHPLTRALRIDKLTLAALEATLRIYRQDSEYCKKIPVLNMLTVPDINLKKKALRMVRELKKHAIPVNASAMPEVSKIGGGAYPVQELPTWVVALEPLNMSSQQLEYKLRTGTPSVITRINRERVLLDMRTIFVDEVRMIIDAVIHLFAGSNSQHKVSITNT